MKPITPDTVAVRYISWYSVTPGLNRQIGVEHTVEAGNLRNIGNLLQGGLDNIHGPAVMQWREFLQAVEFPLNSRCDTRWFGVALAAMHNPVPYCDNCGPPLGLQLVQACEHEPQGNVVVGACHRFHVVHSGSPLEVECSIVPAHPTH